MSSSSHPSPLPLVLASSSTARKRLLTQLPLHFSTSSPDCDEAILPGENAHTLVQRLSKLKAHTVAERFPETWIIGADQVASVGNRILGKPQSYRKAYRQLQQQAGKQVVYHSGICLLNSANGQYSDAVVITTVHFHSLSSMQIRRYLLQEKPYQCAGSLRSEGLGLCLCQAVSSEDPSALPGLPLIRLSEMLRAAHFSLP